MKTTTITQKTISKVIASWNRVRTSAEIENFLARREMALATVRIDDK